MKPQERMTFGIGQAPKLLHSIDIELVRRVVQNPHVRCWQAQEKFRGELLHYAIIPVDASNMVKHKIKEPDSVSQGNS